MNVISEVLFQNSERQICSLIPFLTAGYPNLDATIEALHLLDAKGADIIELGIPYTDALADGPVIQQSSQVALEQGVYIDQVLQIVNQVQSKISAPLVIFTYYNPVLVRGISRFIMELSESGVKGLIIPDLPIEETDYILQLCKQYNIELILFIAPTSSSSRIAYILSKSPGCIYLVSSTGVTGTRNNINSSIYDLSNYIKSQTQKSVIIGFGISNAEQARLISNWNIDGIVIGSAFIKILSQVSSNDLIELGDFCESIKLAIKKS
uniref:Tryptophan synthase alpha chain n=1 Tax=Wrangelia sp. TaxID=2575620 RepID=A0A4D6X1E9_9FLOR|nr:Tryptophan synthase alpha subunit [Wrangelia sp.]